MTQTRFLIEQIATLLPRYAYRLQDEAQLHKGLAQVLTKHGIDFTHEHRANAEDRYDFYIEGGIVLEAKIKGSFSEALRQCDRYMQHDGTFGVILLTTRAWGPCGDMSKMLKPYRRTSYVGSDVGEMQLETHRGSSQPTLRGKPFRIVRLRSQAF